MWRSCEWRNFTIVISTKVANAQTGILTVIKFTQILLEQFEHRAYSFGTLKSEVLVYK